MPERVKKVYYGEIKTHDIANGLGVRVSVFVSGCTRHCPGCFQPQTWDFHYGKPFTGQTAEQIIAYLAPDYIRGLTILGGEPLEPENQSGNAQQPAVTELLEMVRSVYGSSKDIWLYTGYTYEELTGAYDSDRIRHILSLVDVLVDGAFIEEKKNLTLAFRGSENQRILQLKELRGNRENAYDK